MRLDVDERRARLLDLGLGLFSKRNYEDIGIEDIAREAGMSKGLLYHYFGSKRGFYVAVVKHAAAELVQHIEPDRSLDPEERAFAGVKAYLTFVEARAGAYLALMRSGVGADPQVIDTLESTRNGIVRRILEDGLGMKAPRPVFQTAVRGWVGFVEAAALEWLAHGHVERDVLARFLTQMVVYTVAEASKIDPGGGTPDP